MAVNGVAIIPDVPENCKRKLSSYRLKIGLRVATLEVLRRYHNLTRVGRQDLAEFLQRVAQTPESPDRHDQYSCGHKKHARSEKPRGQDYYIAFHDNPTTQSVHAMAKIEDSEATLPTPYQDACKSLPLYHDHGKVIEKTLQIASGSL